MFFLYNKSILLLLTLTLRLPKWYYHDTMMCRLIYTVSLCRDVCYDAYVALFSKHLPGAGTAANIVWWLVFDKSFHCLKRRPSECVPLHLDKLSRSFPMATALALMCLMLAKLCHFPLYLAGYDTIFGDSSKSLRTLLTIDPKIAVPFWWLVQNTKIDSTPPLYNLWWLV